MIRISSQLVFVVCIVSSFVFSLHSMHTTRVVDSSYGMGIVVGREMIQTALSKLCDGKITIIKEFSVETKTVTNFVAYIKQILTDAKERDGIIIKRVCIGAPGKSSEKHDVMKPYRISFEINAHEIKKHTSLQHVTVMNDFEIIGFGLPYIDQQKIVTVHKGNRRAYAPAAIIGVGTGVGSSMMLRDQHNALHAYPLGYCYADFPVQTAQDRTMAQYIQEGVGAQHMSWGYALGGTGGIVRMYAHFRAQLPAGQEDVPAHAQAIFDRRLTDAVAKQAVDLYMAWYVRLLRTVALTQLPYNGLYITNTVAEQNPQLFLSKEFLEAYFNSGNDILREVLEEIPLFLIQEPKIKLYGAAACALQG